MTEKTKFEQLTAVDCSAHIDKKNTGTATLSYLSWAWAWDYFKKAYPDAKYEIKEWDGKPYLFDEKTGYMVETSITAGGETYIMWLPVMNGANKAMKDKPYTYTVKNYKTGGTEEKTVEAATMFDINTSIMRCLVKNMAMFGLGLYIYAGEDLPADASEKRVPTKKSVAEYMGDIDNAETEQEINNLFYEWSKIYVKGTDDYKTLTNKSFERKKQIVGA